MEQDFVVGKKAWEKVFQKPGNGRFAKPAQTEGSECNAELDGAQVSIHVFIDFQGDFSALAPRMRQFLKLGAADFYDCEFWNNEKSIAKN